MIDLSINGERQQVADGITVAAALEQLGYAPGQVAVAVNGEFVPRSRYDLHELNAGDCVDIVAAVQGG